MGVPANNFDGLERQRRELEDNILKLQQSLYHWRTWEAEYDGLKEEIAGLDDDATPGDFLRVSRDFGGSLVNEEEVRVIIGHKQGLKRTRQQVADIISRRIDYVKENIATMEKRLHAAENELNDLDSTEQLPAEPSADFPVKEIIEELDENGEVISSTTATPGDEASDLLDILKKVGVKDVPDVLKSNASTADIEQKPSESTATDAYAVGDAKGEHKLASEPAATSESTGLEQSGIISAHNDGSNELNSSPESSREVPVVDVDESPGDAELRREMLRYSLDEVGAVVAELELDEDASEISIDDEDDSYTYDDDDDEEEDEFGRSTRPVLDEDYHLKMRELEAKLNARGMWNVGKDVGSLPDNMKDDLEQPRRVKVEKSPDVKEGPAPEAKPKKKVAFAEELDIAPAPEPPAPESKKVTPRETDVPVLSDSIVERTEPSERNPVTTEAPKKTSRFKSARTTVGSSVDTKYTPSSGNLSSFQRKTAAPSPSPSLPLFPARPSQPKPFSQPISDIAEKPPRPVETQGKILADTVFERDTSEGTTMPPEPDELDEELHRKEIATEFYRIRNRMIKQCGGFLEEPETIPIETEEEPRRVSKFRAARMR